MARSPVKKQPEEPDPADLALLEELHAELGERDAQIDRLTRVLQRKQDERDLLHSNFSQLVLQVQALRGQVAEEVFKWVKIYITDHTSTPEVASEALLSSQPVMEVAFNEVVAI